MRRNPGGARHSAGKDVHERNAEVPDLRGAMDWLKGKHAGNSWQLVAAMSFFHLHPKNLQ
jgi:hypothetical protein